MIPKLIHMTWKTRDVVNDDHPLIEHGLKSLVALNPDWELQLHEDAEVDQYLQESMTYDEYSLIRNAGIVQKSDLWRLYKIHNEGGLYVDIDRICNQSITPHIRDGVSWVLPVCIDYDFSHDMMLSASGNPVYKLAIRLYLQRLREGHTNVYFLGSQTYMHAITMAAFGKIINTNPGVDVFRQIKDSMKQIPFIQLVDEQPPYKTFLYDGPPPFDHETMKRDFYGKSNVKHWTGDW